MIYMVPLTFAYMQEKLMIKYPREVKIALY